MSMKNLETSFHHEKVSISKGLIVRDAMLEHASQLPKAHRITVTRYPDTRNGHGNIIIYGYNKKGVVICRIVRTDRYIQELMQDFSHQLYVSTLLPEQE